MIRLGIITPVVTRNPRAHNPWEREAGPAQVLAVAQTADRLGYHHLTCSEHVGIPTGVVAERGGRYYDPLATFGFIAGFTERIRLATHVLVLPYHHPLEIAKRYGTLDRISGGRLILGVGVGSLEEEFRLLDAEFEKRGPLYEDALAALRAAFGRIEPSYAGSHYRFEGFVIDPCGVQERVPIWVGGRSARSLRRALEWSDGWDPFRLNLEELRTLLAQARSWPSWRAREERGERFEIVLTPERAFDVSTDEGREQMRTLARGYAEIGATVLTLRFRSRSLESFLEQIEIFAERIAPDLARA